MPRADGTWNPEQRPEADVNIEFQSTSKFADPAMRLAFFFREANEKYATDYPAAVGPHMTNTDSTPFMNLVPAISLRENERRYAYRIGMESNLAPTNRCIFQLQRQRLCARSECRTDHARSSRSAGRRDAEEVRHSSAGILPAPLWQAGIPANPDNSRVFGCRAGIIRSDCVTHPRAPRQSA